MKNKIRNILIAISVASSSLLFYSLEKGQNIDLNHPVIIMQKNLNKINPQEFYMSKTEVDTFELDNCCEVSNDCVVNAKMEEIKNIEDKKEFYLAYKDLVETYSDSDMLETIYDCFTDTELELLFKVVQAEIGDEYSFDQKVNVASVIFNRLKHNRFPDSLVEILVADQFSTISNGRYQKVKVSSETILACEYAFSIGDTTNGCLFFDSNSKLKYAFVFTDGAHNFYTLSEE